MDVSTNETSRRAGDVIGSGGAESRSRAAAAVATQDGSFRARAG